MALDTKVKKTAKEASIKERRILFCLKDYYNGEFSLEFAAGKLKIPLRALMEFMTKHHLPQYWQEEDRKRGLKRLSEIHSTL
ncbi:MAG: hypothetical protein ACREBB_06845 [Nitrosotalea sp.]